MKCVTTVSYSVVLNGNNGEIFSPSRGLRQCDPLSPFLFLFCGEGLSSLIKLGIRDKVLKGVKASRSGPQISHLLFADDCILFGEATERDAVGTNSEEEVRRTIIRVLGVRSSNDPQRYLGLPNMVGRKKKAAFQILKDRLRQRIDNWSIKCLSQGGKEVFIKAVLQSIPTYSMACFLLPKSLCSELEGIIAKFWWRNNKGKKGIHWCAWKDICVPKEFGGLGFRNLDKFNIALLAKQGWRLITYSNSLLACVLKAKYYPNENFLDAALGNLPSLTWRSIWSAKGILEKGLCWRVGKGDGISVWTDLWVSGNGADRLQNHHRNENIRLVADLIDETRKILQIPLAKSVYEDFQVWGGEPLGKFSVRSAYKLLQESTLIPSNIIQTDTINFYKKLWSLNMPSKIKITVWRISWNYIPTFSNLKMNRVTTVDRCLRCQQDAEDSIHVFRSCPTTKEVWKLLNFAWVLNNNFSECWDWLTWVSTCGTTEQCRTFCCGLWRIWWSRNKLIYEGKKLNSWDITRQINSHISELERVEDRKFSLDATTRFSHAEQRVNVAVSFDAAYDQQTFRSASGLVVYDVGERILASKAVLHSNVASPFAAKAHAGLQAVRLGEQMGFTILDIIGDSKTVIMKCQSGNRDSSNIGALIRDIQATKSNFQEIRFRFIPRTENTCADLIAREMLYKREEFYLEGEIPDSIRRQMEQLSRRTLDREERRKSGAV
ncbi:reverse transcriptase [Gossypium australe]|uniref:Reverse transcriptase n=1 Tax=Gossypium australe TaxID=47621 RepID=A0A5B6URV3_9ROSI|nr:reverse transcriptase [Gossypium australe]